MSAIDEQIWWIQNGKVIVSKDGLHADLVFTDVPESAGIDVTFSGLLEFIKGQGVVTGVEEEILSHIIAEPRIYVGRQTTIAHGTPVQHGLNATYNILLDTQRRQAPKLLDDGSVDFFDVGSIQTVAKDQLLAIKTPATAGVSGLNVYGQPIPAKPGQDIRLPKGTHTSIHAESTQLISDIDGYFVYIARDQKVHVFSIFEVDQDVDFSIGHIEYNGSVMIRGNVQPGFRVSAAGNIDVMGYVDSAFLEAGGHITIRGGVQGRNKGTIKAAGTIRTLFIQNAVVDAGEEAWVGESVMHSAVTAAKRVIVEGRRGVLVGGITRAGEEIQVRTLGSPMSTPTQLEVGILPALRSEWQEVHSRLQEIQLQLDKVKQAVDTLDAHWREAGSLSGEKQLLYKKLQDTRVYYDQEEGTILERKKQLDASMMESKSAKVTVLGVAYPGIRLTIGQQVEYVRDEVGPCEFINVAAQVIRMPLAKR